MKYWDIYNINGYNTDKLTIRNKQFKSSEYHLIIHVCIFNSKKYCSNKDNLLNNPGLTRQKKCYKEEISQIAATRETFKKLDIILNLDSIYPYVTINFFKNLLIFI